MWKVSMEGMIELADVCGNRRSRMVSMMRMLLEDELKRRCDDVKGAMLWMLLWMLVLRKSLADEV